MGNNSSGSIRVSSEKPLPILTPPATSFNPYIGSQPQKLFLEEQHQPRVPIILAILVPPHTSTNPYTLAVVTSKYLSKYHLTTGEIVLRSEHTVPITTACFAQDPDLGAMIALCSGSQVELVSALTLGLAGRFDHAPSDVCSAAYIGEGRLLAGLSTGKILQWSLQLQKPVVQYHSEGCMQFIVYSVRHKLIGVDHFRSGHSNVVLYQCASGMATQELSATDGRCLGVHFVDSRNLVIALTGAGGLLQGWDVVSGHSLFSLSVYPHLSPSISIRGLTSFRLLDQDLLLFSTSQGLVCSYLGYSYEEMEFHWVILGKLAQTRGDTIVVSCTYDQVSDVLILLEEGVGAEVVSLFSKTLSNKPTPLPGPETLPLFSLQPVTLPQQPQRKLKEDLPLFSLGLPKTVPEKRAEKQEPESQSIPIVKPGPSEDIVNKIRSRVEGKPSARVYPTQPKVPVIPEQIEESKTQLPEEKFDESKKEILETVLEVKETVNENPSLEVEKLVEIQESELPESIPKPPESKPKTSFELFHSKKKQELKENSPNLTDKEILFRVTELWGDLTEEEQAKFESDNS